MKDRASFAMNMPSLEGTPVPVGERITRLLELGDRELSRAHFEAALDHYREARNLGGRGAQSLLLNEDAARLEARSARCLLRLGRPAEALQAIEVAASIAGAPDRATVLDLEIAIQWGEVYAELGDYRRAEEHAAIAARMLEHHAGEAGADSHGLASWAGRLHNLHGHIAARRGDFEASEAEFGKAVAVYRGAGDLVGLSQAFNNMGLAAKNRCHWSRAREYLTVSERLRAEGEEESPNGAALQNMGIVHFKLGEWADAQRCFTASLELSLKRGETQNQVRAHLALAELHRARRDLARSEESLSRAVALAETHQYLRELALGWKQQGELAMVRGRHRDAGEYLDRAEAVATHIAPEGDLVTEIARLRGELALALGDGPAAVEHGRAALTLARRQCDGYEEALAFAVMARAYDAIGEVPRASESHLAAIDRLRELGVRHPLARALVAAAAHTRLVSPERGQARSYLREAQARFEECGDPVGPFEVKLEGARLEIAAGHLDQAVVLLADAARGLRQAGETRDLAEVSAVERELESALVSQALAARRVTHRARGEEAAGPVAPERLREQLSAVIDALARSTGADGILIAFRSGGVGPFEILAHADVSEAWAAELLRAIPEALEESLVEGTPLIVLDAGRSDEYAFPQGPHRRDIASFIMVPLALGDGAQGFMYLDRLEGPDGMTLGQKDLNLAIAVSEELAAVVGELELSEKGEEGRGLGASLRDRIAFADVVTQNRDMFEVLRLVSKVASTRLTVLIQGETGTGKQLIARAIHASSERRDKPFVTIDCAALPENLLESELFGYRRGAFTGATADRKGLVEEADGGTIFLDEIGRAGLGVQQRLLHLLDCGEIRAVGATSYRQLDVRVISATSTTDLRREVEEGRFLKDLYYRLNDFAVMVPPLRERREDVLLLSQYFLELFAGECRRPAPELSRAALRMLLEYEWPGNVRELQKVVRRAAVLVDDGEPIGPEHLPADITAPAAKSRTLDGYDAGAEDEDEDDGGDDAAEVEAADGKLHLAVELFEKRMIQATLDRCGWNKSRAAEELGLSRKGLRNKIQRMALERRGQGMRAGGGRG